MERPNILIFMTDQQRGDTIPPYGKSKTPNLDKFCEEGIVFSQAYTVAPHCCPSRATFFSGLYPSQHGVWNNVNVGNTLSKGLYDGIRLWSEDLSDAGYQMHFHGKWHVSELETAAERGFSNEENPPSVTKEYKHERPNPSEWEKYDQLKKQQDSRSEGEIKRKGYPPYIHYGTKPIIFH